MHASDLEAVNAQDTVMNNQGLISPGKAPQSTMTEDNNSSKNLSHSYEEVEEKGNPVTVCDKEDMIPPEEPKVTVVKSPSIRNILKEKMVPCGECSRVLSYQKNLTNHMGIHTEKILQACYICGKIFNMKSNMSQHAKKAHEIKSPGIRNVLKKEMFPREECSKVLLCQKRSNMIVDVVTAQLKTGATR